MPMEKQTTSSSAFRHLDNSLYCACIDERVDAQRFNDVLLLDCAHEQIIMLAGSAFIGFIVKETWL